MAVHAMDCSRKMRCWRGVYYANVTDDCSCCELFVGAEYGREGIQYILCGGDNPKKTDQ